MPAGVYLAAEEAGTALLTATGKRDALAKNAASESTDTLQILKEGFPEWKHPIALRDGNLGIITLALPPYRIPLPSSNHPDIPASYVSKPLGVGPITGGGYEEPGRSGSDNRGRYPILYAQDPSGRWVELESPKAFPSDLGVTSNRCWLEGYCCIGGIVTGYAGMRKPSNPHEVPALPLEAAAAPRQFGFIHTADFTARLEGQTVVDTPPEGRVRVRRSGMQIVIAIPKGHRQRLHFDYAFLTSDLNSGPANNDSAYVMMTLAFPSGRRPENVQVLGLSRDLLQNKGQGAINAEARQEGCGIYSDDSVRAEYSLCTGWHSRSIDVQPYAGGSGLLRFYVEESVKNGNPSALLFDNVRIEDEVPPVAFLPVPDFPDGGTEDTVGPEAGILGIPGGGFHTSGSEGVVPGSYLAGWEVPDFTAILPGCAQASCHASASSTRRLGILLEPESPQQLLPQAGDGPAGFGFVSTQGFIGFSGSPVTVEKSAIESPWPGLEAPDSGAWMLRFEYAFLHADSAAGSERNDSAKVILQWTDSISFDTLVLRVSRKDLLAGGPLARHRVAGGCGEFEFGGTSVRYDLCTGWLTRTVDLSSAIGKPASLRVRILAESDGSRDASTVLAVDNFRLVPVLSPAAGSPHSR